MEKSWRGSMKRLIYVFIIISLTIMTACGGAAKKSEAKFDSKSQIAGQNNTRDSSQEINKESVKLPEQEQKIIYNSEILIVLDDLKKFSTSIGVKTREYNGIIQQEEIMESDSVTVVRIPTEKFNQFIDYVESLANIKNKRISTKNITDAYVDNDSRLKNLKAQESQTLEIFKRAGSIEEILKVQNELFRIRGEIEALEGRKKLWDNQIEYATITITAQKLQGVSNNSSGILSANEFAKSIRKGFVNSIFGILLFLQRLIIFVLSNIIWIVVLIVAGMFIYKNRNRFFRK